MQTITPFLWFDDQAEEAAKFYVSVFKKGSKINNVTHYSEAGPRPTGSVMTVAFRLRGQDLVALNGGAEYKFTPAVSFAVDCKNQKQIDELWEKLLKGGKSQRCGWLTDKFGLSWQIVPQNIAELLRNQTAVQELFTMDKLDIARLEAAAKKGDAAEAPAKKSKKEKKKKK